jgi:hypothetical protein
VRQSGCHARVLHVAQRRPCVTGGGSFPLDLAQWLAYLPSEEKPMDGRPKPDLLEKRDLAWEARMIAEADAGLLIPSAEVKAWIDSLGTANPLPMPTRPARTR